MFEVKPIVTSTVSLDKPNLSDAQSNTAWSFLSIDEHGWCSQVRQVPSPNYNERPLGESIDLLVIHNISLPAGLFGLGHIEHLFLNQLDCVSHPSFASLQGVEVSSHFFIDRAGEITQFVATTARAWHAGVSEFRGRSACNAFSIGIELEGTDETAFTDLQYQSLVQITHAIQGRHPIAHIVGHSDIAPGRKTDPGPHFDWGRYQQDLAHLSY
jgi:AmpD protein